ncbi:transcription factor bHLH94-like [Phoenix dactylifera]|uniref:Transcription factor bHLH94-like n=1 Tax=Phoenix dactylifera TaxID=42345 RepID=A0A8B9B1P8_PHODC|nr:transcription factor bHLH94-like [Phoenix dactylifera]
MALDAVVFPQDPFGCTMKEFYAMGGGGAWSYGFGGREGKGVVLECKMDGGVGGGVRQDQGRGVVDGVHGNWDSSCSSLMQNLEEWHVNSSPPSETGAQEMAVRGRRKRRRTRSFKNKEEVENQRMTHIAVERNRRKQMNEYLSVIRSLMPPSYAQRGDQASIIGGAINYVKELEQLLQSLEVQKRLKQRSDTVPFADFFTFPQYSSCSSQSGNSTATAAAANTNTPEMMAENRSAIADIEVMMVDSHANLKVLSRRRPKQLLKLVVGLQNLQLTTLHLNVTTIDQMVLYSFSLKVEDDCQYTSVDEIATAVHQMVGKIQEESDLN